MKNRIPHICLVFALSLMMVGCAEPEQKSLGLGLSSVTTTTLVPGAPAVSTATPLAINLSSKYDGASNSTDWTFTETGTSTCSSTVATPTVTCTVKIPEAQLYYSTLTLKFSWSNLSCSLMTFIPYQYQASNAAGYFAPAAETSMDCSTAAGGANKADCWGGAARDIISDFPKNIGKIYLPSDSSAETSTAMATVNSAYSKKWGSNRWASNILTDKTTARTSADLSVGADALFSMGDGYVANSMRDYTWTCRDKWADPKTYVITLKITDEDSEGTTGPLNHFLTWQGF